MKNAIGICTAGALGLLLSATNVSAQSSRWSVSFDLGTQVALDGVVHDGGLGTVLGLPTQVGARSYEDVYENKFAWSAGLGYRLNSMGELRVQGSYTTMPAERLQVGDVAGFPLLGLFDDYRAFGMDFGYRQYFSNRSIRPYAGASAGFVRLQAVTSEFSVPAAGVVLSGVDFLATSTVPSMAFGGGVQYNVSSRVAVQGGLDVRWHGDATDVDGLAGTGLEGINDETRRWSMPVTGGVTVRF